MFSPKTKNWNNANFIFGSTSGCRHGNLRCHHWRQSRHLNNCRFSFAEYFIWGLWCQKQVSQAGVSNCILQYSLGCNDLSVSEVPASGTKVLICRLPGGPHKSLQWRNNRHDGVSNHQPHDCLLNCLVSCWSKKTLKLRVIGLCVKGGEFQAQRASNAKMFPLDDVIMWCRFTDCQNISQRNISMQLFNHHYAINKHWWPKSVPHISMG